MKMARKLICVLLSAMLSAMLLGGCGQDSGDSEFNIFEGYSTEETKVGGLLDSDGHALFRSELPE